jgi:sugar phosphate isomerase/epimerase
MPCDAGTEFLARQGRLVEALADDALWERVVHLHVEDYAGALRNGDGKHVYLIPGEGRIDFKSVFAVLRRRRYEGSLTLEISALDADGHVDVQRFRQAEAWLASRPWMHPFEVQAPSRQNARHTRSGGP